MGPYPSVVTDEQPPGADDGPEDKFGADEAEGNEPETPRGERPLGVRLTGAAMRGLHRAIYGGQDDAVVIVADASGDPPSPDGLDLHLDPDHPEASTVVVHSRPVARRPAPPDGNEERDGKQDG
jgi:hypothetical protein